MQKLRHYGRTSLALAAGATFCVVTLWVCQEAWAQGTPIPPSPGQHASYTPPMGPPPQPMPPSQGAAMPQSQEYGPPGSWGPGGPAGPAGPQGYDQRGPGPAPFGQQSGPCHAFGPGNGPGVQHGGHSEMAGPPALSPSQSLEMLFRQTDTNADGMISREEFSALYSTEKSSPMQGPPRGESHRAEPREQMQPGMPQRHQAPAYSEQYPQQPAQPRVGPQPQHPGSAPGQPQTGTRPQIPTPEQVPPQILPQEPARPQAPRP